MRIYNFKSSPRTAARPVSFWKKLQRKTKHWNWKKIATWAFRVAALGVLAIAILFIYVSRSLPDPNRLLGRNVPQSTKIYDRNGGLLYEVHGEVKRTLINLDQMSPFIKQATISAEDRSFYNHGGISLSGVARSIYVDVTHGKKLEGGSTITQQFVKNAVLSNEKSWWRKIKEVVLSIEIEARFSKDDILKLYLNEIPYGRNAYGVEAASQTYFAKSAKDLTLAESAYLAALPNAPTYYNPNGPHRDALDARQRYILGVMKDLGYINDDQYQQALDEKVPFVAIKNSITAPYFVFYVQDYLAQKYGERTLEQGGLKVYTTLDPKLQKIAEDVVSKGVAKYGMPRGAHNAALTAIDPKTGQILAMVGGKDYFGNLEPAGCIPGQPLGSGKSCLFEPNVNVATSPRQPGSSFKPYAYVTAFGPNFKYAPASLLMDVVTNFGTFGGKSYIPHNYSGQSYGPVSMRKALAGSLNVPAVKTLALVGVDNVTQTARDLGITTSLQNCGLSLVLGGCEVKLVDHVAAFSALANEGNRHEKTTIMKIEGDDGRVLEQYASHEQQVIDPQAAYELINIMTDNNARSFVFGSNSPLTLPDRTIACKTGTTQNWRDGWTLCFTPSLAVGVWSGNNDGTLLKQGADGVFVAAPLVNDFMKQALAGTPAEEFAVPNGITKVTVDSLSGKLPTQYTPSTKSEVFASYAVPTDHDNMHVGVKIDTTTGEPATDLTPPENIAYKVYTVFHSEKPNDPNWEAPVIAWARANGYEYPPGQGPPISDSDRPQVSITSPSDNATLPQGSFQVTVTAESSNGVARIDLSVDGDVVDTATSAPHTFTVSGLANGQHTISAHAIDSKGVSNDTSIIVNIGVATSSNLSITSPDDGDSLSFPATITAESSSLYTGGVSFYYQGSTGTAKLIGTAQGTNPLGGNYAYQITWSNKPASGSYKIFARGDKTTSAKINVIVP